MFNMFLEECQHNKQLIPLFIIVGKSVNNIRKLNLMSTTLSLLSEHIKHHRFSEIIAECEKALKALRPGSNEHAIISSFLAEALVNSGRNQEAITPLLPYKQSRFAVNIHPIVLVRIYLVLASAYRYTSNLPEAISFARQALQLLQKTLSEKINPGEIQAELWNLLPSNKKLLGGCYHFLGVCYRNIGEFKLALDFSLKAVDERKVLNEKNALAASYSALAYVLSSSGQYRKTETILFTAVPEARIKTFSSRKACNTCPIT